MENWRELRVKGYVIWQYIGKKGCDITVKKDGNRIVHLTTDTKRFLPRSTLKEIIEECEATLKALNIEL